MSLTTDKICFLMSFGHCGIDWLHSLFDSHPQILIPPAFSPYRYWKILKADTCHSAAEMHKLWVGFLEGPDMQGKDTKFFYSESESTCFREIFMENLERDGIKRIPVIMAILDAYACAKKINTEQIRSIVIHEHVCYPFSEIMQDLKDPRVLMIARDPRAAIAGYFKGMNKKFGDRPDYYDYYFDFSVEEWLCACDIWNQHGKKNNPRFKILKNEVLHQQLETEMQDVAKWLDIDFKPTLLKSTYPNDSVFIPDSCYISRDGQYPEPEETFFLPENVRKRWQQELSDPREILMIETLFSDFMEEFGYAPLFPKTFLNHWRGVWYFLLPHRGPSRLQFYPVSTDEIPRTENSYKMINGLIYAAIWKWLPLKLKNVWIFLASIRKHFLVYFFPGDRWKRYDIPGLY